jgi:hypothetical protein
MTDLDHELQASLRSHAGTLTAPSDFAKRVDDRLRVLRRRRYAIAVATTAPMTAGVVVGAVALSGGHAAKPAVVHDRPAASSTPNATPTTSSAPVDIHQAIDTCSSGTVPRVVVGELADNSADPRGQFQPPAEPDDIIIARVLQSSEIVVAGGPSDAARYFAFLDVNRSGPTLSKSWLIAAEPATDVAAGNNLYHATFTGCVTAN